MSDKNLTSKVDQCQLRPIPKPAFCRRTSWQTRSQVHYDRSVRFLTLQAPRPQVGKHLVRKAERVPITIVTLDRLVASTAFSGKNLLDSAP